MIENNTLSPKAHRARKARGLVAALDLRNFNSRSNEIQKQDRKYCRGIYLQKKSKTIAVESDCRMKGRQEDPTAAKEIRHCRGIRLQTKTPVKSDCKRNALQENPTAKRKDGVRRGICPQTRRRGNIAPQQKRNTWQRNLPATHKRVSWRLDPTARRTGSGDIQQPDRAQVGSARQTQ